MMTQWQSQTVNGELFHNTALQIYQNLLKINNMTDMTCQIL